MSAPIETSAFSCHDDNAALARLAASLAAADRAFCAGLLPRVSRTFAPSIEALPAGLCEPVRVAYLLCRVVDSIEDEGGIPRAARLGLFDAFDRLLVDERAQAADFERACAAHGVGGGGGADGELCRGAGAVVRAFRALPAAERRAILPHVLEMSAGMRAYCVRIEDGAGLRIEDLDDLERYCYFVAGTVGRLLTGLFELVVPSLVAARREALRERAVAFGLGLQMVNIVKDVAEDLERGACFLPLRLSVRHGVPIERLLDPALRPHARALLGEVCGRAAAHLSRAREYAALWPVAGLPEAELEMARAIRFFCVVPLALARATLAEVEVSDDTLRRGRSPKISREQVARVFAHAGAAACSDEGLAALLELPVGPAGGLAIDPALGLAVGPAAGQAVRAS